MCSDGWDSDSPYSTAKCNENHSLTFLYKQGDNINTIGGWILECTYTTNYTLSGHDLPENASSEVKFYFFNISPDYDQIWKKFFSVNNYQKLIHIVYFQTLRIVINENRA